MNIDSSVVDQLMAIKGGSQGISYNPERDRFNMPHSADTCVSDDLNANRMTINGVAVAIASQYPFPHQVEAQLQMLLDNSTPVLVVLASSKDIANHQLPEYFSGSATYGDIETRSKFVDYLDLGNSIEAKQFTLSVTKLQESIDIPVLHVFNWPDHRTVSSETTTKLIELIESNIVERRAFLEQIHRPDVNDADKMLPVIHCKAGVGRTGQTIAAMAMKRYPALSLETITKDLRISRNDRMIQTPYQMETLVKLDNMRNVEAVPEKKPSKWRSLFGSGK